MKIHNLSLAMKTDFIYIFIRCSEHKPVKQKFGSHHSAGISAQKYPEWSYNIMVYF
jgi:hypothetical protein